MGAGMSQVTQITDPQSIVPLLSRWQQETNGDGLGIELDMTHILSDIVRMMGAPNATILGLVRDDLVVGFMGIDAYPSPTGPQAIANEHYLYVASEYRGLGAARLIKAARQWAQHHGCEKLLLNASRLASKEHDSVCRLYERLGARPFETTYIMEVP